jgi:streptogramin lyase
MAGLRRTPTSIQGLAAFVGAITFATVLTPGSAIAAPPHTAVAAATVTDVGVIPLTASATPGGATARMPDGTWRTWLPVSGKPAYLAEIDPRTDKVVRKYTMPDAQGAWGVDVAGDGTVYVATYGKGELFRLRWHATAVEDLRAPTTEASFLWQVDTGHDGTACTGTFEGFATGTRPPAHLACWSPKTRSWRDYGTFGTDDTYVRSTAVIGQTAYAGTGSTNPRLYATDLRSGTKQQLTLPAGAPTGPGFVYELDTLSDRWLAVRLSISGDRGYVYDTWTRTWAADLGAWGGQTMSEPDTLGRSYFQRAGHLAVYNVWTRTITDTSFAVNGGKAVERIIGAGGHPTVVGHGVDGLGWRYDLTTGKGRSADIDGLTGEPVTPRATTEGPDGKVYVSGYFSGGLAAFDPVSRQWEFHRFPPQAEGMGTHNGKLYLGAYTGADLWEYDPGQPFVIGTNPKKVLSLRDANQDRPYAVASAGDYVAMGTEGAYGVPGGALALYDPRNGTARRFDNLTNGHTVAGLAYNNGRLFAGTTVFGGNGAPVNAGDGRVFAMDPVTGDKIWDVVPIAGEKAVSSLTVDAQGQIWGVTAGKIFELNPATGAVLRTKQLVAFDWSKVGAWNPITVKIAYDAADNSLYLTTQGKLWRINESTLADSGLNIAAGTLVSHTNGTKYWVNEQDLYQGRFP